jgi:hypothetical protein
MSCVRNDSKLPATAGIPILDREFEMESEISMQLDSFMKHKSFDALLVFRIKSYDCSECKAYFIDLYKETRKMTDQAVMLSRFSGNRSVSVFKKMSGINDSIINSNSPIAKIEQSAYPFVFLYRGNGIITSLFVPVNGSPLQNMQAVKTVFKSINYSQQ